MIYCPHCGTANRHGSKFCNECGDRFDPSMQQKCPRCGTLNPIADALCNECGESLAEPPAAEDTDGQDMQQENFPFSPTVGNEPPPWLADIPPPTTGELPGLAQADLSEIPPPPPIPWREERAPEFPEPEVISEGADLLAGIADPLPAEDLFGQPPAEATLGISAQFEESSPHAPDEAPSTIHSEPIRSILAIDCGSTLTRVYLISLVEDLFRLTAWAEAPSSLQPPWSDITVSVRQALDNLARTTRLRILDELGQIISPEGSGGGVDAVVSTTSACRPLRLVLAVPTKKAPMERSQRALSLSYAVIKGLVTMDGRTGDICADDVGAQVRLIQEMVPDALVVVGGGDRSTCRADLDSVETMALACDTLGAPDGRPPIIYTGDASLQPELSRIVGDSAELQVIEGLQLSEELEDPNPLQTAIEDLHDQRTIRRLPGYETLATWDSAQMLPTARALACTTAILAQYSQTHQKQPGGILANVLAIDVGGATTTAVTMTDGSLDLFIGSEMGTSYNAARILDYVSLDSVLGWVPLEIDPAEARNTLYNKELHPHTMPQTRQDLFLEQAVVREILGWTMAACAQDHANGSRPRPGLTPRFDLIVGRGGVLSSAPDPGLAALMLLDGLQPVGISRLALDRSGLAAAAGAVAAISPQAAVQVLERDALLDLGTVVAPMGAGTEGKTALTIKIEYQDGRAIRTRVPFGSLEVIPLPTGTGATLKVQPSNRFDLGAGTKGKTVTQDVKGGVLGIIIDARGRPLLHAKDPAEQRAQMQRWLTEIGSQPF